VFVVTEKIRIFYLKVFALPELLGSAAL